MGIPEQVASFDIKGLLGEDAEGPTLDALQRGLNRRVAIRFLPSEMGADETYRERFLDQARKAYELKIENTASLIDIGTCSETQRWYLVYEFVEGTPVLELKYEPRQAVVLCSTLCDVLAEAEAVGVVHGAIHPKNVLVDDRGEPKLLNLGMARVAVGADGRWPDAQGDIYSLGILLYHLMTGQLPGGGKFDPRVADATIVSPLAEVVLLLTSRDPAQRLPDAGAAAEALRQALDAVPEEEAAAKAIPPPRRDDVPDSLDIEETMVVGDGDMEKTIVVNPNAARAASPSGRITRGRGHYDELKPKPPSQREERPSQLIQRSRNYYGADQDTAQSEERSGTPNLSLDDPGKFQAGWEIYVKEKGSDGVATSAAIGAARREHYFRAVASTMEKLPAFELTQGPGAAPMDPRQLDVKPPRQILRGKRVYEIERMLGKGGQGTVFKANVKGGHVFRGYERPTTVAAIKISKNLEALLSERAIYSQPNPGVIKLLDAGNVPGRRDASYLALERLYPHPFQLFTREGQRSQVDLATAVDTYVNLLLTVHELHYRKKLPLVLCDIKPDNIMLRMSSETGGTPSLREYLRRLATGTYEPVLLDMGCAQHHGELRKARGRLNVVLGTPLYMSPEAAPRLVNGYYQPGVYHAKLDVYALTLSFYYFLTGVRPYTHTGLFKTPQAHLFDELISFKHDKVDPIDYDLLEEKVGSYHIEDIVEILQKGLHPDPDYRATAKMLFKLCEKKFRVKETRPRDPQHYRYDNVKGLCLMQDAIPRIRPEFNLYLNPESAEATAAPKKTGRFSRETGQYARPELDGQGGRGTGRHARPDVGSRGTGRHKRPPGAGPTGKFRR